jgi:chloride channel protein, CIC family
MTGDFALTLPVMLAVAIASTISRALSYGTIYTTKLLRRGTDIDRTTPWRALSDLKVAQAMRPFRPSLPVPPGDGDGDGGVAARDWAALAGPVAYRGDPQALFGTESLAQALRQLEVYGRDGLPVLSADGRQIHGWVTAPGVLRAISRQITAGQPGTAQAQASADWEHADPDSLLRHPPTPLPGYQIAEITITAGSTAAGRKLGDVTWPRASAPVSVLRGHQLRPPRPEMTLAAGDRVSLLTGAPGDAPSHPAHGSCNQSPEDGNGNHA